MCRLVHLANALNGTRFIHQKELSFLKKKLGVEVLGSLGHYKVTKCKLVQKILPCSYQKKKK